MATNGNASDHKFRVVIIGAGIAGLTAAISLHRLLSPIPHAAGLQITLCEKATELREIGASIGLNPSGLRILDKLGVDAALGPSSSFRQPSGRPMVYRHWLTNEEIGHDEIPDGVEARHRMARFHRAHLHMALLQALPGEGVELRLATRVRDVEVTDGGVVLSFEDGSTLEADLLVGADGIHSKIRKTFAPAHELKWTGQVAFRAAFDVSLVQEIEGLPDDAVFFVGHERVMFASRLGKNQYTIVGNHHSDPDDPDTPYRDATWEGPSKVEILKSLYQGWNPVVEALAASAPYVNTYPNYAGSALPSLTFTDRVVLLGDAAHTHGGAFAAGGSLAINDAYALALALAHVWPPASEADQNKPTSAQLGRALKLYDETRRPLVTRVLNVVHANKDAKKVAALRTINGTAETDEQLRARIANRPDMTWLTEHDVEAEFQSVVAKLEG